MGHQRQRFADLRPDSFREQILINDLSVRCNEVVNPISFADNTLHHRNVEAVIGLAFATSDLTEHMRRFPSAIARLALSHNKIAEPLISSLSRVQRWSAAFDYSLPRSQLRQSLTGCNAFREDLRSYKLLFPPARSAAGG